MVDRVSNLLGIQRKPACVQALKHLELHIGIPIRLKDDGPHSACLDETLLPVVEAEEACTLELGLHSKSAQRVLVINISNNKEHLVTIDDLILSLFSLGKVEIRNGDIEQQRFDKPARLCIVPDVLTLKIGNYLASCQPIVSTKVLMLKSYVFVWIVLSPGGKVESSVTVPLSHVLIVLVIRHALSFRGGTGG